jgi:flagellar assembly protein FliH
MPAAMTGRIIASGFSGPEEKTFGQLSGSGSAHAAVIELLESEYMERVRARATAMAKDMLTSAQAEAALLKEQARQEGLAEGRAQAQSQTEQRLGAMATQLSGLLDAIGRERVALWEASRRDYLAVLKLALEKTLNIEIDTRREEILGSLINQALDRIDSQTMLAVTVNPEDEAMATDLLERAKAANTGLAQFKIKTSPGLNPGSVVMESQGGRVDNSLESRFAGVMEVIAQFENVANGEAAS